MISPELLKSYPYFGKISETSLKAIAMMAEEKTVPANTELFMEGDPAKFLYIVVSGEVQVQYVLGSGERRTVDTRVSGDLFMWSALIEPYKATSLAITTKETHFIAIDALKLRALCDSDPQVGYRLTLEIAKILAERLLNARVQLATV
jgi:CRP-like cAMP-binding protein